MDLAGIDVREKLDLLQLPLEAKRPLLLRFDPSSEPVHAARVHSTRRAHHGRRRASVELRDLRRFAEDRLKPELEAVEGSAAVKVSGGYEDEIQILVDQQKLAQLGLSIDAVTRRVRAENVNLSGGRLEQGTQRFLVRTLNEFAVDRADGERDHRDASTGSPSTCATSRRSRTATRIARRSRASTARSAIELAVYKEGDANTVQLAAGVREQARADRQGVPGQAPRSSRSTTSRASSPPRSAK